MSIAEKNTCVRKTRAIEITQLKDTDNIEQESRKPRCFKCG